MSCHLPSIFFPSLAFYTQAAWVCNLPGTNGGQLWTKAQVSQSQSRLLEIFILLGVIMALQISKQMSFCVLYIYIYIYVNWDLRELEML